FIDAKIAREAEIGKRIPLVRAACSRGERSVTCKPGSDSSLIAKHGSAVDAANGNGRVTRKNHLSVFQRAGSVPAVPLDAGYFNESVERIGELFNGANDAEGFNMFGEGGPGFVAMFARQHQLGVC